MGSELTSATLHRIHDRLGAMIDQIGHPDYSLRELVDGLREVRDALFAKRDEPSAEYRALFADYQNLKLWHDLMSTHLMQEGQMNTNAVPSAKVSPTPDNVGDSDRWQDPRDVSGGETDCIPSHRGAGAESHYFHEERSWVMTR